MSIRKVTDVFCDDCGSWSASVTDKPAREARAWLKENGWLVGVKDSEYQSLSDYCDQCRKSHE